MKIETELREDHQMKVVAEFESVELDGYKQKAARKISKESKIPGFRPGKAPYAVVKRMFGDGAIQQEAVELLIDDKYPDILKETGVKPSHPGALEEIVSLDPPKFSFIIPLEPEVELGDFRSVRKEYAPEEVSEEEVEGFVNRLRHNYATAEPVERAAQAGDLVAIKLTGTLAQPDEGEEAVFIKERPYQVVIGDSVISSDNYPYEGFSNNLIGLLTNDEKDVHYTYPGDAVIEKLRGREMIFHIAVQSVKQNNVPELTDEFALTLGEFETVDALMKAIRENLETQKRSDYDDHYFEELIDTIVEQATVKYSPPQLDEEIHRISHNIEDNLAQQGLDLETYLKITKKDQETFTNEEVRPSAIKQLKRSLVLDQIAHELQIRLEQEEMQAAFNETIQNLARTNDLEKLEKRMTRKGLADAIAYQSAARAINQRVLQRLKAIATGQGDAEPVAETTETAGETTAEDTPASTATEESPASEA